MRACLTMKDVVLGRTKSLAEIETIHIIKGSKLRIRGLFSPSCVNQPEA